MAQINQKTYELNNGKTLVIRTPKKSDAQDFLTFVDRLTKSAPYILMEPGELNMTLEQEQSWIQSSLDSPSSLILMGEIDGKIVAITNANGGGRFKIKHIAHLGTSVDKEFRGLQIGTLMMKELCNWAKSHKDLEFLQLSVMKNNRVAHRLYQNLGFVDLAEIPQSFRMPQGGYETEIQMRLDVR